MTGHWPGHAWARAEGKHMDRPFEQEPNEVAAWRMANQASIANTAAHWGLSPATVKRYCAGAAAAL